jgi:hypothetical protein
MKTPIIEDFDPKARERKLGSPLDGMPAIERPPQRPPQLSPIDEPKPTPTSEPKARKQPGPKPIKSGTRSFARRTFDFYADQIAYLTRWSLDERFAGREGSMNAFVREAMDAYIEKHKKR